MRHYQRRVTWLIVFDTIFIVVACARPYLCESHSGNDSKTDNRNMTSKNYFYCSFASSFAAVVAGLNLGVMSGALDCIVSDFSFTSLQAGFVTSILMIGCLAGALAGGRISDRYGRIRVIRASVLLILASSVFGALASGFWLLAVARLLIGCGVGVLSTVIPVYISEVSSAKWRGTLVSLYQFFVVVGILISYLADYKLVSVENNWRWMLAVPALFSVLSYILLKTIPESGVWLSVRGGKHGETIPWKELFRGLNGKILFLGILLAAFQQITGINAVINYAPGILRESGIGGDTALLQSVYVGIVNLLFTVVAVWLVDRLGRKKILIGGCAGLVVSLAILAYEFMLPETDNIVVLTALLMYIAFFALSLSPLMFVVTSEIYPSSIRGSAMAVSTGVSWVCAFIVVQLFPVLLQSWGGAVVFAVFGLLCLAAMVYIWGFIPETKGKSLEEIENYMKTRYGK